MVKGLESALRRYTFAIKQYCQIRPQRGSNRFSKYTVYQRSELNHCRFSVVGDGGLPGDASAIGPAAVLPDDRVLPVSVHDCFF
ncbi:hypothetical protein PM8797T_02404 [Gimesia maris DSM 8797]|uniref:Uncharacterized protein n=1 Tax=Gimesia maris TaxID=122 RepID=A0ABX5YK96_9PLAN|nr:hypothetical protein PM8797T_02404 [Gimesia maris DSM 8797]QEG16079.1 hypothetical protein GmarT_19400 [Gimesia maris]